MYCLPTHLHTHPPTYPPTELPTYLPTQPPTHLPTYLPTYQPTYLPAEHICALVLHQGSPVTAVVCNRSITFVYLTDMNDIRDGIRGSTARRLVADILYRLCIPPLHTPTLLILLALLSSVQRQTATCADTPTHTAVCTVPVQQSAVLQFTPQVN